MVVNVAGSITGALILGSDGLAHVGIAAATALAGWVNAALLFGGLLRRGDFRPDGPLLGRSVGFLAASLAVMIVATVIARNFSAWFFDADMWRGIAALGALVTGSAIIFLAMCQLSGAVALGDICKALRKG